MKFFKIVDGYANFHDGQLYKNKIEMVEDLKNYHDNDWNYHKENDEELTIDEWLEGLNTEQQLNALLEHGQWEIEEVEGIECPFCGEPIEPKEYNTTHIWSCIEGCPFIAFEYVEPKDLTNLTNYINK